MTWRVLDLFSGIGGFSLGLGRAGFATVRFCEIDAYCRAVLEKHWPGVPCTEDIATARFEEGEADVVCGGFPCQDISFAGAGAGLAGARSGLFRELVRAVCVVRPRWALLENVAALLVRGMGTVLGCLAEIGYDAEWHCIPAAAVGAPHRRDRVWIVADPTTLLWDQVEWCQPDGNAAGLGDVADADGELWRRGFRAINAERLWRDRSGYGGRLPLAGFIADERANANRKLRQERGIGVTKQGEREWNSGGGSFREDVADADGAGLSPSEREILCRTGRGKEGRTASECGWWAVEPDVGRVAHGIPHRVDRLGALGSAVVPQIPESLGWAIRRTEKARGDA